MSGAPLLYVVELLVLFLHLLSRQDAPDLLLVVFKFCSRRYSSRNDTQAINQFSAEIILNRTMIIRFVAS